MSLNFPTVCVQNVMTELKANLGEARYGLVKGFLWELSACKNRQKKLKANQPPVKFQGHIQGENVGGNVGEQCGCRSLAE